MASTSSNNSMTQSSSSTSSSSVTSPRRNYYDVFVSFRGEDTRFNFTDHLFAAFERKGIFAFRDDTNLHKGESIAPELLHAIQDLKIFVVVFSKNYASSTWCLRELESILESIQLSRKRVLPVFYDVDPSEVRYQKGSYGEAFEKHEQIFQQDSKTTSRWREALKQVANLSGWNLRDKPEYAEIEKIVHEVINILDYKFSSLPKDLVGMDSPIEELEKHLLLDLNDDVRIVGICGMGGIGKTTLATALYNKISHQFFMCCFIDDLSKIYRHDGPISAQKQILLQTLGEEQLQIYNHYNTSNLIRSRLHRIKALIILDNVDQVEQLEKLAVSREWLGPGSRVIIISRDEHILKKYGVDVVYKVSLLNKKSSLQLLSRKAFKLDQIISSYDKLALDILHYANGLPLAIKVLGSFLFGRNISEWESALARLEESPNKDIMDVLQLSYDGLEEMEKEIFLHIACFFNWCPEKYVKNVLNCCGFHADIGLRVLIDKSLLISSRSGCIQMHGLLKELGRKIVQQKSSNESRKWSRVWLHEQFFNVILENMEKNVEAVHLVYKSETKTLMSETLSKMNHLILLILKGVNFSGNLSCLSNKLRYVEWDGYPFTCLPSNFQPNQLVELILKHSSVKQLWKDKKYLPNLRTLDMSHSKNLRKMPDFQEIPNLERLCFKRCVKLEQIDPSIGVLRKLVYLNLKDCIKLVSIPNNIFSLISLEYLNLWGCLKLFKNPKNLNECENASHSQSITSSILKLTTFRYHSLYLNAHQSLVGCSFPSLLSLSSLLKLDISFCGLSHLPDAIGCLHWLDELNLGGNNFVTLPSLSKLSRLAYLNLDHSKLLEFFPQLPFPIAIRRDLRKNKHWNQKGLVIFNCPKLGERERCSSVVFPWMIQLIEVNQEYLAFFIWIGIVIPGSEVPSWFYNHIKGDLIRIDSSNILHENNLAGIAFCGVFSVAPVDPTATTYAKMDHIGLCFYNSNTRYMSFSGIPVILESDVIVIKSDHIYLTYYPLEAFFDILKYIDETLQHLDHINMKFRSLPDKSSGLEVQSCGYRWVYKQDHSALPKLLSSED